MARALLVVIVMKAIKLVSVLSVLVPSIASADAESIDSSSDVDHAVVPVRNALELGIATGYSQGGGDLGGGMANLEDIAGAGVAVEIDLGYRVFPNLTLGVYGTFAGYAQGDLISNTAVLGGTAGLQAAWHFRPEMSLDPWVSVGGGWKALWLEPDSGDRTSLQGFDLARVQIGLDYRVTPDLAIAPVVGGSLGLYVGQNTPMSDGYSEIEDKEVNFTGFAGLSGRFGAGGAR
jgi:hypothetical protein